MLQVFIKHPPNSRSGDKTKQSIEDAFTWVARHVLPCNMQGVRAQDDIKSDHSFITTLCDEIGSYLASVQKGSFERDAQNAGTSSRHLLTDYSIELDNTLRNSGNLHGVTYEVLAEAIYTGYCDDWDSTPAQYLAHAQTRLPVTAPQGNVTSTPSTVSAQYVPPANHKSVPAGSGRDINAEVLALAIEGVNKTACEFSQTPAVKNLNKIIDLLEGK